MKKMLFIFVSLFLAAMASLAGACQSSTTSTPASTFPSSTPPLISVGPAILLGFTTQPAAAMAGLPFGTQPVVLEEDINKATVPTATAAVTLSIVSGTGMSGAVLSGTTTVNAIAGIATFRDLSIDLPGIGYQLMASAPGFASATSSPFDVISQSSTPFTSTTVPSTGTRITTTITSTPPPVFNIKIATKTGIGKYLVDVNGRTLYYFTHDSIGKSNVSDALLQIWPVFYTGLFNVAPGLNASDFGVIYRGDGTPQTTFRGYPLYYYYQDKVPGDTLGQGINGVWFVVDPDNFPPSSPPSSTPASTTTITTTVTATTTTTTTTTTP